MHEGLMGSLWGEQTVVDPLSLHHQESPLNPEVLRQLRGADRNRGPELLPPALPTPQAPPGQGEGE